MAAEAAATGRVVIGTSVGGVPEVIEDGVNGFLHVYLLWKYLFNLLNNITHEHMPRNTGDGVLDNEDVSGRLIGVPRGSLSKVLLKVAVPITQDDLLRLHCPVAVPTVPHRPQRGRAEAWFGLLRARFDLVRKRTLPTRCGPACARTARPSRPK